MKKNVSAPAQFNQGNFLDTPQLASGITRFWFIRHALVEQNARMNLYGTLDVPLCPDTLIAQRPMYEALAARLPREAHWLVTPLSRTRKTAEAIWDAGYGPAHADVEPGFIEQNLGDWQGMPHSDVTAYLYMPPHPFWPVSATECPPDGESMVEVTARAGRALDRLSHQYAGQNIIAVSHGGAIRAALSHALSVHIETALHFSIQNLSVTILERLDEGWRVVTVNELPGI
ncbi:histidine phosphatase family protein [Acetobacter thailandicus]|uniref:Histidine phosphatase family protein n=1 Tax=Acetobacter thailandicus TaxID=1502842 RepID=A0ABT3QE16_9PROT|nr:histidine phosphatase family protein [Acetobacter thailandicus]MCX2563530.1 histidine phosphatase family protein [Acetobacter thailandicus]NHN94283.1 histidine phosphatase family protein [Acetobacter thailandicus]